MRAQEEPFESRRLVTPQVVCKDDLINFHEERAFVPQEMVRSFPSSETRMLSTAGVVAHVCFKVGGEQHERVCVKFYYSSLYILF